MNKIEALLNEYNNLWQEKLIHKRNLRKFHNYIISLTSLGSIGLGVIGLSPRMQPGTKLFENPIDIAMIFIIPVTPIILLIISFHIIDLFHIFVIGNHIGNIEKKINNILGNDLLFVWEHRICPYVYGEQDKISNLKMIKPIVNVIRVTDTEILGPFVAIICLLSTAVGTYFLWLKMPNYPMFLVPFLYLSFNIYLFLRLLFIAKKMLQYTKANSSLKQIINGLNSNTFK
jgi:hypothetical protein